LFHVVNLWSPNFSLWLVLFLFFRSVFDVQHCVDYHEHPQHAALLSRSRLLLPVHPGLPLTVCSFVTVRSNCCASPCPEWDLPGFFCVGSSFTAEHADHPRGVMRAHSRVKLGYRPALSQFNPSSSWPIFGGRPRSAPCRR
jgi:hypothetical protein